MGTTMKYNFIGWCNRILAILLLNITLANQPLIAADWSYLYCAGHCRNCDTDAGVAAECLLKCPPSSVTNCRKSALKAEKKEEPSSEQKPQEFPAGEKIILKRCDSDGAEVGSSK